MQHMLHWGLLLGPVASVEDGVVDQDAYEGCAWGEAGGTDEEDEEGYAHVFRNSLGLMQHMLRWVT